MADGFRYSRTNRTARAVELADKVIKGKLDIDQVPEGYRDKVDYLIEATGSDLDAFFPFAAGAREDSTIDGDDEALMEDSPRQKGTREHKFS